MHGVELCARFSYITNHLCFCGPREAEEKILALISGKGDRAEVEDQLRRFEGILPYLQTIADAHGKEPFDTDVVEAYWIGNDLLDALGDAEMRAVIDALASRGLPRSLADTLIERLPPGMVPHHNANVFYVGVGALTGSVETTLPNMEQCRIAPGKVVGVQRDTLQAQVRPLMLDEVRRLVLGEEETRTVVYHPEALDVKAGDIVAIHWGYAAFTISPAQSAALERNTNRILKALPRHDRS